MVVDNEAIYNVEQKLGMRYWNTFWWKHSRNVCEKKHTKSMKMNSTEFIRHFPLLKFLVIWLGFGILVLSGVHGSSLPLADTIWSPGKPDPHFMLAPLANMSERILGHPLDAADFLMQPRAVRSDEWLVWTPYALSQLQHEPRFPVINTNIGEGQNMFAMGLSVVPIWHIVSLSRPTTWGFFLFGAERGLAWLWWFPLFGCYTTLYLLFKIILRNGMLAAIGAFWFCSSAFVLLWSNTPATVVFFGALICLTSYYIFYASSKSHILIAAIILGLALPGFVILLYPPWQIPIAQLSLLIFIALFIRDKLWLTSRQYIALRLVLLVYVLICSSILLGAYIQDAFPALQQMSNTVYPGKRSLVGGNYSFVLFFRGIYNILTNYSNTTPIIPNTNQSEASSFFYLFPPIIFMALLYAPLRRATDVVTWTLIGYIILISVYIFFGYPEFLAKITLLNFVPSIRLEIGLGLASILLSMQVLSLFYQSKVDNIKRRKLIAYLASLLMFIVISFYDIYFIRQLGFVISPGFMFVVAIITSIVVYFIFMGDIKRFSITIATCLIVTSGFFNPISQGLDYIFKSEVAKAIEQTDPHISDRNIWACYGGTYHCNMVMLLGRKSIVGIHWYPQWSLWSKFDREVASDQIVNRFAHVIFLYNTNVQHPVIKNPQADVLLVYISPHSSILKDLHVRYIIAAGGEQNNMNLENLTLRYRATDNSFVIYELP